MNGSVMPLAGSSAMFTPMLMTAWKPKISARPLSARAAKGSGSDLARTRMRQHDEGEERHQQQAGDEAEFLAHHGEGEVGMGIGQHQLRFAAAGPAPMRPPLLKACIAVSTWKVSPLSGLRKRSMRDCTCGTSS